MREYIGLTLDKAMQKAEQEGYSVNCKVCDSDKQKAWDTQIVVKASLIDRQLNLVSSKFLMRKE